MRKISCDVIATRPLQSVENKVAEEVGFEHPPRIWNQQVIDSISEPLASMARMELSSLRDRYTA